MSRPFIEILRLIEAHFNNDDDTFNNYARAIMDFYRKEGNVEGADEILELIKTGHIEPRTSTPKLYKESYSKEPGNNGFVFSSKVETIPEEAKDDEPIEEIEAVVEPAQEDIPKKRYRRTKAEIEAEGDNDTFDINKADIEPKKRHRRTKAEIEADKLKEASSKEKEKPKRHRRTKEELMQAGYYDTDKNNKTKEEPVKEPSEDTPVKKRHRRTKAELIASGYYDK